MTRALRKRPVPSENALGPYATPWALPERSAILRRPWAFTKRPGLVPNALGPSPKLRVLTQRPGLLPNAPSY
jgi:hypothetical protein